MKATKIPGIANLSTPEKILLVEDLWDDIVSENERITVPESHRKELDKRLQNHLKNPGRLLSLEELQTRIEKRK